MHCKAGLHSQSNCYPDKTSSHQTFQVDFIQHQTHHLADEPGSDGCREMECCLPKLHKAHSDELQQTGAVHKIRKIPISVETQLSAACGKHSSSE